MVISDAERYSRQVRFAGVGAEGQRRLAAGRVVVVGLGALGSVSASVLARAGVGHLRLIDRDFLEASNLQRQAIYDEADLADHLPKAEAAARKLRRVNSGITIEAVVADLDADTIAQHCSDAHVIVDGTDNFEARFLLNDYAVSVGIPWVYGGAIGSEGRCQTIVPGQTACLRCVMAGPPAAGTLATCETAGVLAPASGVVANLQAAEAIKLLVGQTDRLLPGLLAFDLWENRWQTIRLDHLRTAQTCPVCHERRFDYLQGVQRGQTVRLCGRHSVQVTPAQRQRLDLPTMSRPFAGYPQFSVNAYLLRFEVEGYLFTVFADGRAIIKGTDDPALARSLYARHLGG